MPIVLTDVLVSDSDQPLGMSASENIIPASHCGTQDATSVWPCCCLTNAMSCFLVANFTKMTQAST